MLLFLFGFGFGSGSGLCVLENRCPHLYIPVLHPQSLDSYSTARHISLLPHPNNVYYSCQCPCTTLGVRGSERGQLNGRCIERMLSEVVDSTTVQFPLRTTMKHTIGRKMETCLLRLQFLLSTLRDDRVFLFICCTRCRLCTSSWHRWSQGPRFRPPC